MSAVDFIFLTDEKGFVASAVNRSIQVYAARYAMKFHFTYLTSAALSVSGVRTWPF